jgi:hypothetical protein
MIDLERYGNTDRVGRHELEGRVRHLIEEIRSLREEHSIDPEAYHTLQEERDVYLDNLTATQRRCTELLDEVRGLRLLLLTQTPGAMQIRMLEIFSAIVAERFRQDNRWGTVDTLLEIPFGTGESWEEVLADVRREVEAHQTETGRGTCCWAHVLVEESVEALAEGEPGTLAEELVQVAAVAVKALEILAAQKTKSLEPIVVRDDRGNAVEVIHP